jgi:hypothetical protein
MKEYMWRALIFHCSCPKIVVLSFLPPPPPPPGKQRAQFVAHGPGITGGLGCMLTLGPV